MIKTKKLLFPLILTSLILSLWNFASTASAEYNPFSRNLCVLMVKPFDANEPTITGTSGDQYINYLNNVCENFVEYGNAYSPQPPREQDNPLEAGAQGKHLPITKHTYRYYNDTVHDNYYYYKAFMDKFEITLESDGYSSIDRANIKCDTPYPRGFDIEKLAEIEDCSGIVPDLWGGTRVSKHLSGNTIRIVWDFGYTSQNGSYLDRPVIWANNGSSFSEGNFTNENSRYLEFDVHLPSKNNDQIWSATTSSRALVADLAIKKSNYARNSLLGCSNNDVNSSNSGWCYLTPPSAYETEPVRTTSLRTFYWFPIGSVATVWRETPEIVEEPVCNELNVDHQDPIYDNTLSRFKARALNTNEELFEGPIRYWVDSGHGLFYRERPAGVLENPAPMVYENPIIYTLFGNGASTSRFPIGEAALQFTTEILRRTPQPIPNYKFNSIIPPNFVNPQITNPDRLISPTAIENLIPFNESIEVNPGETVYFKATEPGNNVIHVKPVNTELPICQKNYSITPYQICDNLLVNHQEQIYERQLSTFAAKSIDTEDENFNGKITYSVNAGYGKFYLARPIAPENTSPLVTEFDSLASIPEPKSGFCGPNSDSDRTNRTTDRIFEPVPGGFTRTEKTDDSSNDTGDNQLSDILINQASTGILEFITDIYSNNTPDSSDKNINPQIDVTPSPTTPITPQPQPDPAASFSKSRLNYGLNSILAFQNIELEIDLSDREIGIAEARTAQPTSYTTVTVNPGTKVYFVGEQAGENVIHVSTECTNTEECQRDFDIIGVEEPLSVCASFELTSTPASPLLVGQNATLKLENALDSNDNPLSPETNITWAADTGGTFKYGALTSTAGILELRLDQQPVTFAGSTNEGLIKVYVSLDDPSFSPDCVRTINIIPEEVEPLTCDDLEISLSRLFASAQIRELNKNNLYKLSADATYSQEHDSTVNFSINEEYGTFIETSDLSPLSPVITILRALQSMDALNETSITNFLGAAAINPEIIADENENILLVTYTETPDTLTNALIIQATDFYNEECQEEIPFIVTGGQCETISIDTIHGAFDPNSDYTVLNITGNFDQHPGEIKVTTNMGSLSKFGEENYSQTITYSTAEVANSHNNFAVTYKKDPNYNGKAVEIRVFAVGNSECEDSILGSSSVGGLECLDLNIINPESPWVVDENDERQLFQINVETDPSGYANNLYYTWEADNGGKFRNYNSSAINSEKGATIETLENFNEDTYVQVWASKEKNGQRIDACYDSIRARGEKEEKVEEPDIEKYVFSENDIEDADDIINIGEPRVTPYVTYLVEFTPGSAKSVEITEKELSNGRIKGNLGGFLTFDAMRINVLKEDKRSGDTILKTAGYHNDEDDSNYNEHGNGDDIDKYEDDYKCTSGGTNLCIAGNFDSVINDFKKGKAIEFRNINKLGEDGKIIIKYQMKNQTIINDAKCRHLTSAEGCGEEFDNEIEYTAEEFEDSDDARVIVICPYILTRAGGDIFFHDIIDTGIDVARCSEVKGHEGPGVTPTPRRPGRTPSTGPGDIPTELNLTLPSHDVCRYSNLGSNIEGYNDVLKHFSSTICELRADVAETWTEKFINKSISANITRISRWGQTLDRDTVHSMTDLTSAKNKQSGVFTRINNPLTIGTLKNEFIIESMTESMGNIPAAQTYIVQGANLEIKSNIVYGEETDYSNPNKIPSAAFIVIDGNIIIDPDVTQIDGIIMAIDLDGKENDGKVIQNEVTTNKLIINGNLIGNVYSLFENRRGVGDPTKNEGSVTIYYDERILLNTPPGISELVDLQQAVVPN